jgi:hypothetical protein
MQTVLLVGLSTGVRQMDVPDLYPVLQLPCPPQPYSVHPSADLPHRVHLRVRRFERVTRMDERLPVYEYRGEEDY